MKIILKLYKIIALNLIFKSKNIFIKVGNNKKKIDKNI